MENTEHASNSDHQLMDQDRFQIGGRDTVLLVWSLILCMVGGFLLIVR